MKYTGELFFGLLFWYYLLSVFLVDESPSFSVKTLIFFLCNLKDLKVV